MATYTIAPQAAYSLACTQCLAPATYASDVYRWLVAPNGDTLLEVTVEHYCQAADDDTYHGAAPELYLPDSLVYAQWVSDILPSTFFAAL